MDVPEQHEADPQRDPAALPDGALSCTCEYEATQTGAPIMRALVYEFQDDKNTYDNSFDFLFGRSLLVANVIEKGAKSREVYLSCRVQVV